MEVIQRHGIAEILPKLALNTNKSINQSIEVIQLHPIVSDCRMTDIKETTCLFMTHFIKQCSRIAQ